MKTGTIKQEVIFTAKPEVIYDLIMNEEKHAEFTQSEVSMSNEIGGTFSAYDGYIKGKNSELIPGKKIVQEWHFDEEEWDEDHFSICTFIFEPFQAGTKLIFTQTNIPEHKVEALETGWEEFYWEPMMDYLDEN
jgi:activator of HSP90 ATPase